jgi:D-amino peptidase
MKKLYLSVDIEGMCGINDWIETEIHESQGALFRKEMALEAAVAAQVALDWGVDEVLIKDAHDSGRSINPNLLPRQTRLIRSWTKDPYCMMAGLDQSFLGACYLGYHSAGGSDGNPLAHTLNLNTQEIRINGIQASEFLINSYTASSFGVPSLMISGDEALCAHALVIAPQITTVPVLKGIGKASVSIHPAEAQDKIKQAVLTSLEKLTTSAQALVVPLPKSFTLEIEFLSTRHYLAHQASFYPGMKKTGPRSVELTTSRWIEMLTCLHFVL